MQKSIALCCDTLLRITSKFITVIMPLSRKKHPGLLNVKYADNQSTVFLNIIIIMSLSLLMPLWIWEKVPISTSLQYWLQRNRRCFAVSLLKILLCLTLIRRFILIIILLEPAVYKTVVIVFILPHLFIMS